MLFRWNWVDLVFLVILLVYVWQGWERGVFVIMSEFVAWVVGWKVAYVTSVGLGVFMVKFLGIKHSFAPTLAWIIVVVLVEQILFRLLLLLESRIHRHYFSLAWQAFWGIIPSFVSGLLTLVFLMVVLLGLPFNYPAKDDLGESFFGESVKDWVKIAAEVDPE